MAISALAWAAAISLASTPRLVASQTVPLLETEAVSGPRAVLPGGGWFEITATAPTLMADNYEDFIRRPNGETLPADAPDRPLITETLRRFRPAAGKFIPDNREFHLVWRYSEGLDLSRLSFFRLDEQQQDSGRGINAIHHDKVSRLIVTNHEKLVRRFGSEDDERVRRELDLSTHVGLIWQADDWQEAALFPADQKLELITFYGDALISFKKTSDTWADIKFPRLPAKPVLVKISPIPALTTPNPRRSGWQTDIDAPLISSQHFRSYQSVRLEEATKEVQVSMAEFRAFSFPDLTFGE